MTKNDRRLCRHINCLCFEINGYGWIKKDYGQTAKVEWINTRTENLMMKSNLIIFEEETDAIESKNKTMVYKDRAGYSRTRAC